MNIERYQYTNRNRTPEQVVVSIEQARLLDLRRLPGVLVPERVSVRSGFNLVELDIIDKAEILSPLGNRKKGGKKLYATVEVEAFLQDVGALNQAVNAITTHWENKNKSRKTKEI